MFAEENAPGLIGCTNASNLRFLEDYLRFSRAPVETEVSAAIRTQVMSKPALLLLELLEGLQAGTPDDVYAHCL